MNRLPRTIFFARVPAPARFSLPIVALALALTLPLMLAACSPSFNWREVRPANTRLSLLLPCKPDKAQKMVPLGGQPTALNMLGCDAGGATFAVAVADLGDRGDASQVTSVLAVWQNLTLANMKAPLPGAPSAAPSIPPSQPTQKLALKLPGADLQPPAVLLKASGLRADGTRVMGHAAYFSQGAQVFQVVLYADTLSPEVSETFFSSLKFE